MIDELGDWGLAPPIVVADAGYGDNGFFRTALTTRGLAYIVQVKTTTSMHPADAVHVVPEYSGRGKPPIPRYLTQPVSVQEFAGSLPMARYRDGSWRQGSKGTLSSRFAAVRVRPVVWLLVEWPETAQAPKDYWLSTLPADTPIEELVRLGKIRWCIEHDYRELKHGLGLDHFEGRHWLGWHHHTTLVTAAHLFVTMKRLVDDPKARSAG